MVHGTEDKGHVKAPVGKAGKVRRVALKRVKVCESLSVHPQDLQIAFQQFHGGHVHAFLRERDGISSRSRADLQDLRVLPRIAVDVVHGRPVFQAPVHGSCQSAVLVGLSVKTADDLFSRIHFTLSFSNTQGTVTPGFSGRHTAR